MIKQMAVKISDFSQFAQLRYEDRGEEILGHLNSINSSFVVLIADPALSMRVEDFAAFIQSNDLGQLDPWEARARFSEHLGSRVVYRGIGLSKSEEEALRANGVLSNALRNDLGDLAFDKSLALQVAERLSNRSHSHDPIVSVTRSYGLARALGTLFNRPEDLKTKHVLVIKMTVPELDLFSHHSPKIYEKKDKYRLIGGTGWDNPIEAEEFVFLSTTPQEIQVVTRESLETENGLLSSLAENLSAFGREKMNLILESLDSPKKYESVAKHGLSDEL